VLTPEPFIPTINIFGGGGYNGREDLPSLVTKNLTGLNLNSSASFSPASQYVFPKTVTSCS
jgi:hypothetical protein